MQALARRLVVRRKSDGRGVYDEAAKAELVAACGRPGASVSRLARECGVNANQLSRWVCEHSERRQLGERHQRAVAVTTAASGAFVAVPIKAAASMPMTSHAASVAHDVASVRMVLQARLPNGVVMDLREVQAQHVDALIEAFGRMRCSVSTNA
jgi:transposase